MVNISGKMRAQVVTSAGVLELLVIDIPGYAENEVLVKIRTAAICNGSDPQILYGHPLHKPPFVFGHEPFGEIVACGNYVKNFTIGDLVTWWFSLGAFSEYVVVNPDKVAMVKLPGDIDEKIAPVFELVTATARVIKDDIKDKNVLIIGLGPSGLIMSQRARILGAKFIAGWDLHEMRRKLGMQYGLDFVGNPESTEIIENTAGFCKEFDVIIDAYGNDILPGEPTLDNALALLKDHGKIISYGHPSKGRKYSPLLFQMKNATLISPESDLKIIKDILEECLVHYKFGILRLDDLISATIRLEDVPLGLEWIEKRPREYLKVIVKI